MTNKILCAISSNEKTVLNGQQSNKVLLKNSNKADREQQLETVNEFIAQFNAFYLLAAFGIMSNHSLVKIAKKTKSSYTEMTVKAQNYFSDRYVHVETYLDLSHS